MRASRGQCPATQRDVPLGGAEPSPGSGARRRGATSQTADRGATQPHAGVTTARPRGGAAHAPTTECTPDTCPKCNLLLVRGTEDTLHPRGNTVVQAGDVLVLQASWEDYRRLRAHAGEAEPPVSRPH